MPQEPFYVDDLVLIANIQEECISKLKARKAGMDSKGLCVNTKFAGLQCWPWCLQEICTCDPVPLLQAWAMRISVDDAAECWTVVDDPHRFKPHRQQHVTIDGREACVGRASPARIRARFLSLARSKLRLCLANHGAGYFSNLACDWPSIAWDYSEQETENGHWFTEQCHKQ